MLLVYRQIMEELCSPIPEQQDRQTYVRDFCALPQDLTNNDRRETKALIYICNKWTSTPQRNEHS